ncbi:MAG: DUF4384 domain-containing protein [Alphaproteobacteria bacterium]|nr:DUF4384 domain-containing protein [Alphaproteobacteria bacterium]
MQPLKMEIYLMRTVVFLTKSMTCLRGEKAIDQDPRAIFCFDRGGKYFGAVLFVACLCFSQNTFLFAQEDSLSRSVHIEETVPAARIASPEPEAHLPAYADPDAKANNAAELQIQILPGTTVRTGDRMTFRISTMRTGFLILVDVDSQGKLAQIYPNMVTLANPNGIDDKANFITPESSVTLPGPGGRGGFEFVATPPLGVGLIVAILSDKPLQIIDLPDVPTALVGQVGAVDFVRENARQLRIVSNDTEKPVEPPKWSIATAFYEIR